MIKTKLLYILLFAITITFSQVEVSAQNIPKNPIGFVSKSIDEPTDFHEKPNGKKIKSIEQPNNGWIQFEIINKDGDWVQVKNVSIAPEVKDLEHLNETWIEASKVWFDLSNDGSACYSKPNESSDFIHIKFNTVNLLEIKGNWIKAKFTLNDTTHEGWFKLKDLCGFPWTTCNYEE